MSSSRRKRGEPCAEEDCGSRRFYVGDDGYTYCDQGHRQSERGTIVIEDPGELQNLGRKSRRQDSDAESTATRTSTFSGSDALEHYLLCIQLVLRKQLRWLIDIQKLPEELEGLVKDLWSLRLQKLRNRVAYDSETDTEAPSSQVFSSQSESDGQSASRSSRARRSIREKPKEGIPNLPETLSLCHIGVLLLRLPVTVADFRDWTNSGKLPFYRASRDVPLDMRERLPRAYAPLFEPQDLLQPEAFQQGVRDLLTLFNMELGMDPPRLNTPLIMYRWMKDLALPIEVFAGTQRLSRLLGIDISYSIAKPDTRIVFRYPEAHLMALLVVATKLLFPLDSRTFRTRTATDLSAVFFDWDEWKKSHQQRNGMSKEERDLTFERAFQYTESDCTTAGDKELDAYLEWCEDNLASEDIRENGHAGREADFRRALFDMFPMQEHPGQRKGKEPEASNTNSESPIRHPTIQPRPTNEVAPEDMPAIGNFYRRFRTVEDLSGPAQILFKKAAGLACISLENMVHAVFWTERKMQKLDERLKKTADVSGLPSSPE